MPLTHFSNSHRRDGGSASLTIISQTVFNTYWRYITGNQTFDLIKTVSFRLKFVERSYYTIGSRPRRFLRTRGRFWRSISEALVMAEVRHTPCPTGIVRKEPYR
jgi:hypothetical protein